MKDKIQLFTKISEVMQEVRYLAKDGQIKFGTTNYKAISEEKVTATVRDSLINNKLIIIPVEQDHKKDGNLTTVNTKYKICDCETGDCETIVSSGTGTDTQDKGVGKAMTYSFKYLLLRTFAIPTGEDPDKVSSAEHDKKQKDKETEMLKYETEMYLQYPCLNQVFDISTLTKVWNENPDLQAEPKFKEYSSYLKKKYK